MDLQDLVKRELPAFQVERGTEHAGRRQAAMGANLENMVTVTNISYERHRYGVVKKNQVRTMVSKGRVVHLEKATVDFDGYLKGVGFVAFDAKTHDGDEWRPDRRQLHQLLYLLIGQRMMPKTEARFFYLLELRRPFDRNGSLRVVSQVYLVECLEDLVREGKYKPRLCDKVYEGTGGILLDYRQKLIATPA